MKSLLSILASLASLLVFANSLSAAEPKVVDLWPSGAPGESEPVGPERDLTMDSEGKIAGRRLIRLGNVSKPTLTVYQPSAESKKTDAAVLIFPGGAYHILALDLEGTEVCEWLNSRGVTAILLKYRVPRRKGLEKHAPALQDAQRAMGLIRQNAKDWGIDPAKIGVLGFSAGGHLAAAVCNTPDARTYPAVDEADRLGSRPNFGVLIYPAYLTLDDRIDKLSPELAVSDKTPPTFVAITMDDPVRVEGAMYYALALKNAKVPVEAHFYPNGGHGYGLRRTQERVTSWPDRLADWMTDRGLLPK